MYKKEGCFALQEGCFALQEGAQKDVMLLICRLSISHTKDPPMAATKGKRLIIVSLGAVMVLATVTQPVRTPEQWSTIHAQRMWVQQCPCRTEGRLLMDIHWPDWRSLRRR